MALYEILEDGTPRKIAGNAGSGLPVGAIFASAIPLTDARVHLLDGSTISQTGVYAGFANLIKTLVSSGYNISCSETEFNNDVTTTGNCGKFVIDNANNTIRLPKITTFIQGLSDVTNIGKSLSAGLPNITGYFGSTDNAGNSYLSFNQNYTNGAFSNAYTGASMKFSVDQSTGSSGGWTDRIAFNANSGASTKGIYGNSTTVQPNSTQFPYYIVLVSGYKSNSVLEIDNIINDLNNKQDTLTAKGPALNTTRTGQNDTVIEYYVSSDATTWYRKWASGWKECGGCFMSADTSSGVYLAFPITFEQSVHAIQFTDTESGWNSHGCIPKALYWPENEPANYDGKAGMRVLTPALNVGTLYAKHRISYYAQGY